MRLNGFLIYCQDRKVALNRGKLSQATGNGFFLKKNQKTHQKRRQKNEPTSFQNILQSGGHYRHWGMDWAVGTRHWGMGWAVGTRHWGMDWAVGTGHWHWTLGTGEWTGH